MISVPCQRGVVRFGVNHATTVARIPKGGRRGPRKVPPPIDASTPRDRVPDLETPPPASNPRWTAAAPAPCGASACTPSFPSARPFLPRPILVPATPLEYFALRQADEARSFAGRVGWFLLASRERLRTVEATSFFVDPFDAEGLVGRLQPILERVTDVWLSLADRQKEARERATEERARREQAYEDRQRQERLEDHARDRQECLEDHERARKERLEDFARVRQEMQDEAERAAIREDEARRTAASPTSTTEPAEPTDPADPADPAG
jgi:hypothetical protein